MTIQARWKSALIAESDKTVLVEGNHYFPPEDVNFELLETSELSTHCTWKGDARYYNILVGGELNQDAVWYYPAPYSAALGIKNHLAFWSGVEVTGANPGEPEILPPPATDSGRRPRSTFVS
jgi:uncharacterized protein (DUF427 family)